MGTRVAARGTKFEDLDTVVATMRFASGAIGKLGCNFACVHPHYHGVRIYGTEASFVNAHRRRDAVDPRRERRRRTRAGDRRLPRRRQGRGRALDGRRGARPRRSGGADAGRLRRDGGRLRDRARARERRDRARAYALTAVFLPRDDSSPPATRREHPREPLRSRRRHDPVRSRPRVPLDRQAAGPARCGLDRARVQHRQVARGRPLGPRAARGAPGRQPGPRLRPRGAADALRRRGPLDPIAARMGGERRGACRARPSRAGSTT